MDCEGGKWILVSVSATCGGGKQRPTRPMTFCHQLHLRDALFPGAHELQWNSFAWASSALIFQHVGVSRDE